MSNTLPMQVHIEAKPIVDGDTGPQIIIGFTGPSFSQAIYFDASQDAAEAVAVADQFYKGLIEAMGASVRAWKDAHDAEGS